MKTIIRSVLAAWFALPALALAAGTAPGPAAAGHVPPAGAPVSGAQPPVLQDIKGVVSWNTLAKVKQIKSKDQILPEFDQQIMALNGQVVRLQGFMMPLEPGSRQSHFLISLNSQSCAYCMPAGPDGVVEVKSKAPIKYTFEPILLSGRMNILKNDPTGLYYRLTAAEPVAEK